MEKHYLFKSGNPFDRIAFEDTLGFLGVKDVTYFSPTEGMFLADSTLFAELVSQLPIMREDLGVSFSFLISHESTGLEKKLLEEAFSYFPNQALFPTDVLLHEMSFGDYSSYPILKDKFRNVPSDLLLSVGTYLRCGLDAKLAAKTLFIHRNTFLYRLNRFIEITNLDIRDYHNALFLELYFQLEHGFLPTRS
ncbi:MAG: helix-turn-helix domain-containing protein [Candidatus Enteromonas sp.]|nr:helix-turn-helix domain-containing protein [Candidatus Enteromonas sp.]